MALNGLESLYGLDMRRSEEMTAKDIMETKMNVVPCHTTASFSFRQVFDVVGHNPLCGQSGYGKVSHFHSFQYVHDERKQYEELFVFRLRMLWSIYDKSREYGVVVNFGTLLAYFFPTLFITQRETDAMMPYNQIFRLIVGAGVRWANACESSRAGSDALSASELAI